VEAVGVNVPNALSLSRLALVPVLLVLAFAGLRGAFVAVLALSFATDILDGFIARRLGQTSTLGARLDSLGDFAVYMSLPLCAWWLLPEVLMRNAGYFAAAAASVLTPALVALARFRQASGYHTLLVKAAALLMGGSLLALFAGAPEWLFRAAVPVSVLAAVEEIAITLVLREPRTNIPTLLHALRMRRRASPGQGSSSG
jgi:CDP-diacylglycerol--glycerol-3-phosphate 3-phosphatidyltransferase